MPRYKLVVTRGWQITPQAGKGFGEGGCTASILDTAIIHREVKRYRSENLGRNFVGPAHRQRETIRQAQAECDRLNALEDAA